MQKLDAWFYLACGWIVAVVLVAILAPLLPLPDPLHVDMGHRLQPPCRNHWFGTDQLGRDLFSRVLWASRVSVLVGVVSVGIASVLGTAIGVASGYYGRGVDLVLMRAVDLLLCFPLILTAILLIAFFGSTLENVLLSVGIAFSPRFARVARGSVLSVRQREFVEGARAVGCRDLTICVRHVLPNILSSLIVLATLYVPSAILIEANLSYLGLGVRPPHPTWGSIINDGRKLLREAPWISLFPGLILTVTVLAFNVIGDTLRDRFDPRLRHT